MNCVDAIRDLATPSVDRNAAGLAEHLARCPRCASWAERDARLQRIWEATRPPELSDEAWGRIWANVSESLEGTAPASPASPPDRPTRRLTWGVFALAQAAAILAAVVLLPRHVGPQHPASRTSPAPALASAPAMIEIDQDQVVLISLDGQDRIQVKDIVLTENANGVDPFYKLFNTAEAIAALQ